MSATAHAFLARLPVDVRGAAERVEDLPGLLARAVAAGVAAWPMFALPAEAFIIHLGNRIATLDADSVAAALAGLQAADLYLACAVAHGDARALAELERAYFPEVDLACRRRSDLPVGRDDVAQLVRERLLVPQGGEPARIAEYSGRGALRGWFRTSVVRVISNLAARPQREVGVEADALAAFPILTADPELEYMKRLYKVEFEGALTDAIHALPGPARELLRQSLIEQLSIDQLAVVHGAHRATLARRIAQARESLFTTLRESLQKRLRIDEREFESILRLVRSRFDLTMERVLGAHTEA